MLIRLFIVGVLFSACFPAPPECTESRPCESSTNPCSTVACVDLVCVETPIASAACNDDDVSGTDAADGDVSQSDIGEVTEVDATDTSIDTDGDSASNEAEVDSDSATEVVDVEVVETTDADVDVVGECEEAEQCTTNSLCELARCDNGRCVFDPKQCEPIDECHQAGVCEPTTGLCTTPAADEGTPCDDSSACTTGDACRAGRCVGTAPDDSLADWSLVTGEGHVYPTTLIVDRSGAVIAAGAADDVRFMTASGDLVLSVPEPSKRVFLARLAANGTRLVSAMTATGDLLFGEVPFATVATFSNSLERELIFMSKEGNIEFQTSTGDREDLAVEGNTIVQARLETGGAFKSAQAWGVTEPAGVTLIGSSSVNDTVWLIMQSAAERIRLPADTAFDFINPDWTAGGQSFRSFAARVSTTSSLPTIDKVVDFFGFGAFGTVPSQVLGDSGFDVPAISPTGFEIETASGPTMIEVSTQLTLRRFSSTGQYQESALSGNVALIDEISAADLQYDYLFQGLSPKIIPRADGGFFIAMRLRGTREFGDERNSRKVIPGHPTLAIASYELGGRLAWVRLIEDRTTTDLVSTDFGLVGLSFLARADGSIVVAGATNASLHAESSNGFVEMGSSDASFDGFIVVWERDGRLVLAENAARGPGFAMVSALADGDDGSIYMAGQAEGPTELGVDGSAGRIDDQNGHFGFVARLNSADGLDCR